MAEHTLPRQKRVRHSYPPVMEGTKQCRRCDLVLPITDFRAATIPRDGREARCRDCANRRLREQRKALDEDGKEKMRLRWKQRVRAMTPQYRAQLKAAGDRWREKNRADLVRRTREWREANVEAVLAYRKAYEARTTDQSAARASLRRARLLRATPPWLTETQKAGINAHFAEARRLSTESGLKYSVDHVVPLRGATVCGLHVPWNMRVIPLIENIRKNATFCDSMTLL